MRVRRALAIVGLIVLVALLLVWLLRMRIAGVVVDRKLASAGVPAAYRITRIGPFLERMEDVRLGDPARPDLIAKRIDVTLGYGLTGPKVTGITVDGVRLRGAIDGQGLHLGAIDRLLPKSGGATKLPDLQVALNNVALTLATPNGTLHAQLAGRGNPARHFTGRAAVTADALRLASCTLASPRARLDVAVDGGLPTVSGPIALATSTCPDLSLRAGTLQVRATSNATFEKVTLRATLAGFGGRAGPARFARLQGPVEAEGMIGNLAIRAKLGLDHLALPTPPAIAIPASLPIAPIARRAADALAALLRDTRGEVALEAKLLGTNVAVRVAAASLTGRDGARARLVERGGLTWSPVGWRADGDLAFGGGALPNGALQIRQPGIAAPIDLSGRIARYRAGTAALTLPALRLRWEGTSARFAARAIVDGPLGDGFVSGLDIPIVGTASRSGAILIGQGCQPVTITSLRQIGFTFGPARLILCGQPIISRTTAGALRIDTSSAPVHLAGRSASGVPLTLDAARLRLTNHGFTLDTLTAELGESHLHIAALDGRFAARIDGSYRGATGAIANVPLILSDADGRWAFDRGALTLTGGLRVSDAASSPRFYPLLAEDMRFTLRNNVIDATATLRAPATHAEITRVALTHALSDGTGHATLTVPGITFVPKRLQPEALTPITLGVVANVAGTITGAGRIDWNAKGVTSRGRFGTERLDLAAAFGPVIGIKGHVDFTDLLGMVSAPHQEITIAEINPGVAVTGGVARFQLIPDNRVRIESAEWPFASGLLRLEPTTLDFGAEAERHLTFRVDGLDAGAFIQQLDFPNISATGTFDGVLPMIFDKQGGRIEDGYLTARKSGGTLAYVGELSQAQIGTMGKLAFDALKAIRYSALELRFDGKLDGEMVSQVNFIGIRQATPDQTFITRLIRNLPFKFNIRIRAPFRGLVGTARTYMDPSLLLNQVTTPSPAKAAAVQPPVSGAVR